jgi:hypothetical protein
MLDDSEIIIVRNRDNGIVGYKIPEMNNLKREFMPKEQKKIAMGELRALSYIPGGDVILKELLVIENKEAVEELVYGVEPEYFYTEEDIKRLLTKGTLDEFKDCLDFAPEGVINLIQDLAVKLEISDLDKRKAIFDKTGFNVTKAIEINYEAKEIEETTPKKERRVAVDAASTEGTTQRRTAAPKYTVK